MKEDGKRRDKVDHSGRNALNPVVTIDMLHDSGMPTAYFHTGDCTADPPPRLCAAVRSTSRHSAATSPAPSTPASSQLRSAGSHAPHRASALARCCWSARAARSASRTIGRASSAERCTSGENAGTEDCVGPGGAGPPGDEAWFAEDVERRRLEEAGLVTESDRDERLRGAVGDCGAGEAAPTALFSGREWAAGCGSAPDREVGEPAAALRVETVDSEADSCEIDSNDVLSESSEVSRASARLFICGGRTGSGRGFCGEPD